MEINREILTAEGYSFPFEGEAHAGVIVELPYRADVWREGALPAAGEFVQVITAIAQFEPVIAACDDRARSRNGKVAAVDFGFNAWGGTFNGLYSSWDDDNALGRTLIADKLGYDRLADKGFILEGGSIHTDGKGTLLTTAECLLSKGRNPNLSKEQIEAELKATLGIRKVIWLPYGVYRDETTGHVDNIACFLDETHVLLGFPIGDRDPQYRRSKADEEVLKNETNAQGQPLEVIRMPMPGPLFATAKEAAGLTSVDGSKPRLAGERLAGSYVNFLMGEKYIVMPAFNCPEDSRAKNILERFYGETKKVIQVPGREILLGGGNIHCITKQIPQGGK